MKSARHGVRYPSFVTGLAIGLVALAAQGQTLNVTLASKTFTPAVVPVGGISVIELLIINSTGAQISGVTVTDTLPPEVTILSFYQSSGCDVPSGFFAFTIAATVTVSAGGACRFSYFIKSSTPGVYANSTANISGWNGNTLAFTPAALVVGLTNPNPIPTLSDLTLFFLVLGIGFVTYRTRFHRRM